MSIDCCILLASVSSFCRAASRSLDSLASRHSITCLSVRSMVTCRSLKSTGLVMKSNAPRFIAVRMFAMSPYADMMTDRMSGFTAGMRSSSVRPSITGMLISDNTMSMFLSFIKCLRASAPFEANENE